MKAGKFWLLMATTIEILLIAGFLPPVIAQQNGAALYLKSCAQCHEQGSQEARVPSRSVLAAKSADEILRTLQSGVMAMVSKDISEADKIAIAEFVSGKRLEQKLGVLPDGGQCQATLPVSASASASEGPQWNGWGNDLANSRFQSAAAEASRRRPSRSSS